MKTRVCIFCNFASISGRHIAELIVEIAELLEVKNYLCSSAPNTVKLSVTFPPLETLCLRDTATSLIVSGVSLCRLKNIFHKEGVKVAIPEWC